MPLTRPNGPSPRKRARLQAARCEARRASPWSRFKPTASCAPAARGSHKGESGPSAGRSRHCPLPKGPPYNFCTLLQFPLLLPFLLPSSRRPFPSPLPVAPVGCCALPLPPPWSPPPRPGSVYRRVDKGNPPGGAGHGRRASPTPRFPPKGARRLASFHDHTAPWTRDDRRRRRGGSLTTEAKGRRRV